MKDERKIGLHERKIGIHPIPSGNPHNPHMETPLEDFEEKYLIDSLFDEYLDKAPPHPSGFPHGEMMDRPVPKHSIGPATGELAPLPILGAGAGASAGIPEYMLDDFFKNR